MKAGWEVKALGNFAVFENGDRGKNYPGRKAFVEKGIPFVNAGHLNNGLLELSDMNYIPQDHFHRLGSGKIKRGDLLFCLRGSLGKFALIDNLDQGAIASSLVIVRPNAGLLATYLSYYFESPLSNLEIEKYANGAAQPNLSAKSLAAFKIPLPPLQEQQRIVAILDEAFEGLDRARANAEANLQSAGELTNLATEKCLTDAEVKSVSSTRLGNIAKFRNGLNFKRGGRGETIKLVGVGDFKDHFQVQTHLLSEVSLDGKLGSDDQLQDGDLLAVRSNGNKELIGRTMLVPALHEKTTFSGFTIRIRLETEEVLPEYVCELMRSKRLRRLMVDGGGGANISNLNQQILDALPISYPNKDQQRAVLERIEEIRGQTRLLVRSYEAQNADLQALRESMLQKAFAGELT